MAVIRKKDENLDSMIRRFKKDLIKANFIQEIRKREYYVSPGQKKRLKKEAAKKRIKQKTAVKKKLY